MTHYTFALRYKNCSTDDLIKFVRQRTGNLRRDRSRSWCMHKLKQLDREVTFRFFDLPPELRNRIYEFLLHHSKEASSVAYPAVLRASSQVYKEACGILYDQSVFVTNSYRHTDPFGTQRPPTLFQRLYTSDGTAKDSLYDTICPAHRLRIRHLTLHVRVEHPGDEIIDPPKHIFPALLKYFGAENPLKTLTLVYHKRGFPPRPLYHDDVEREFRQLRELPESTRLKMQLFPPALEAEIRALIGRPEE